MSILRWGIIGCGDVCEVKSGPGFQKATGSALVAVMRRDREKAEDFARRHGVPRFYDDARAIIADPEVDAIYVATPPSSHAEYTILAARAGKPVYVEKPMAPTKAACDEMIAECAAAHVPLFVAYYRRALPRFVRVKEIIDSGALGELRTVATTLWVPAERSLREGGPLPWRYEPAIGGAGLLLDVGSHTIDLLDHLIGPITQVSGHASNRGGLYAAEDTVTGHFTFASGVHGTGSWCFATSHRVDRTELVGSRGRLTFATFDDVPLVLETESGREELRIPHPPHVHQPLIQTVIDSLAGRGVCPSTAESGARATWVLDQLLASWRAR
jgi:1,5-anhydro-D-fructose reductase (1,5-anhydro-D-mannitol-forming)